MFVAHSTEEDDPGGEQNSVQVFGSLRESLNIVNLLALAMELISPQGPPNEDRIETTLERGGNTSYYTFRLERG